MKVKLWAIQPGPVDKAELVERAARVCYRSKMSDTKEKRNKFLGSLERKGHLTVFEHARYVQAAPTGGYGNSIHKISWSVRHGTEITQANNLVTASFNARNMLELNGYDPALASGELIGIQSLCDLSEDEKLAHASATFEISGISRACSHQLVRHRKGSYSQESQRYVDMSEPEFIVPPSITQNDLARTTFWNFMDEAEAVYCDLLSIGVPREDARSVLPNATATRIVVTMVFADLAHFFRLRCAPDAQWEIRELANEMLRIVYKEAPGVFQDLYEEFIC